jgi:hypothetical protein
MKTKKRFFLGVAIDASLWQQPLQRRYDMDDLLINVNIANEINENIGVLGL